MAHLLPVQREYMKQQSLGKTEAMKDAARLADKKVHAELNALRARACNAECFDCSAKKPGWAVLPHGVFVCIDCAQIHRNLGRHVSQTKAINTGTYIWYEPEIAVMREVGNFVAARAYAKAPPKPAQGAAPEEKRAYAEKKYATKEWGPVYGEKDPMADWRLAAKAKREAEAAAEAAAKAAAPPPRPRPAAPTGLRAAKKAAPDLMSFEPLAAPPAPAPSPAPAPAAWSEWSDEVFRPAPAPVAALADGHEKKKLAILSMFGGHKGHHHTPTPIAAGGGGFFGQYGL